MVEIIPAILPKTFAELEEKLALLAGAASLVQVDLVGSNILAGVEAPPLWEEFDFEFDIMLQEPAREIEACIALGASRIVIHAAAQGAKEALLGLQDLRGGSFPTEVGVALRAHDTLDALVPFENLYDYVQVMGIDHEGKQGEPPDPHHKEISLIKNLRAAYPELIIQVDGAVAEHPQELAQAGANRLVVGAAIINAHNPKKAIEALYNQANVE